jgi:hypothetical protein
MRIKSSTRVAGPLPIRSFRLQVTIGEIGEIGCGIIAVDDCTLRSLEIAGDVYRQAIFVPYSQYLCLQRVKLPTPSVDPRYRNRNGTNSTYKRRDKET